MTLTVFFEIFELVIVNILQRWKDDEICTKITTILGAKKQLLWTLKDDICGNQTYEKISKIYSLVDYFKLSKFECDCLGMKRKNINDVIEVVFFEQLNARFCEEYNAGSPIISDKEYDNFLKKITKKYPNLIKKMQQEHEETELGKAPNYPKVSYSDVNIEHAISIEPKYDGVCVIVNQLEYNEEKKELTKYSIFTKNGRSFHGVLLNKIVDLLKEKFAKIGKDEMKVIKEKGFTTFELLYKNHTRTELVGVLNTKDEEKLSKINLDEIKLIRHGEHMRVAEFSDVREFKTLCKKSIKSLWEKNGYQADGVVIYDGVNTVYVKDYINFSKKTKAEKK